MNYKFLLYSFLGLIFFIGYYIIHRLWLDSVKKKQEAFYKLDIKFKIITDWIILISLVIGTLFFFLKAIN
jgi:hypothetical protein